MSRGPLKPPNNVVEQEIDEGCSLCHRAREEHHLITVHVCYSDKVIKHWMCPNEAIRLGPAAGS